MTISGFASSIPTASASASKKSTTTGRAPSLRTNSALSGERIVPQDLMAVSDEQRLKPASDHACRARQKNPAHETP
jgi:hypothetical protein